MKDYYKKNFEKLTVSTIIINLRIHTHITYKNIVGIILSVTIHLREQKSIEENMVFFFFVYLQKKD